MDKPTPKERLIHILEAVDTIRSFMQDVSEADFSEDLKLQSAVQYQFLILGEAIGQIDGALLSEYDYPWHIPKSFRNFIIHAYHAVKMERIYYATKDLNELEKQIRKILKNEFNHSF